MHYYNIQNIKLYAEHNFYILPKYSVVRPDLETVAHFSLPPTCHTPLQLYFIHRLPRDCHTASVASLPNELVFTGRNVTHFSYKYILVNLGYFYVLMG